MVEQVSEQRIRIFTKTKEKRWLPCYASGGAAGADVRAAIDADIALDPGKSVCVPTGLCVELPAGYEIQVRPRSGLALKHQITVLNAPGTIDADYRGEIQVILINHGCKTFIIEPDMRIAQIVLARVIEGEFVVQQECLSTTDRGEKGFGHTGIN